jgi:hypothetical protein
MVKSKFSFLTVYFALAVICFFILTAISTLFILGFQQASSLLLFAAAGVFAGYYLIGKMIVIKVSPDKIELRGLLVRQTIFRDDIRSIDLGGREPAGFLKFKFSTNAIVIRWGRSDEIVLPDSFYRNMPELKRAMHENFLSASTTSTFFPDYVPGAEAVPEGAEAAAATFAGQPLLNIHTILFLGYLIFIAIALRPVKGDAGNAVYAILLAVVFIPMYITVGFRLYYFRISDEHLIVKNHFFPWYTKGFKLTDVSNVVVGSSLRRVISLRINTRGFFSRRFSAGSLRKADWKDLQQALEDRSVPVKNELPQQF